MRYVVVWTDAAAEQLAAAYLASRRYGEAAAVTAAANRLDDLCRHNPTAIGESRSGHLRLLAERPLAVEFEVHDEEQAAVVLGVRYLPPL